MLLCNDFRHEVREDLQSEFLSLQVVLLLQSGNDCAAAIAEHISGSQEAFAELMNTEAKQLGATGTHFVNPHGLHDENHYNVIQISIF